MQQKAFKEILEKYLSHSCSSGEKALVEEWFEAMGRAAPNIMSGDEEQRLFEAYKEDFQKTFHNSSEKAFSVSTRWSVWMKLAATVLIILGPLLYLYVSMDEGAGGNDFTARNGVKLKKIINERSSAYAVVLSDGSRVVLNPGSVLTYKSPFDQDVREVTLEGEAFFDVTPDSLMPFVVRTGQLMTSVLGTSFTIKANKGEENIIVTVKTGKVLLKHFYTAPGKHSETALLTPNQQAVCNIEHGSISRRVLGDLPSTTPDSVPRYRFHQAPVAEILRELERQHRFKIIFDESDFTGCLLSTSLFSNEDLFMRLDIICKAIGATYKVDGVSVLVSGKACSSSH